jgi:hypothetical protein
MLGGILRLSAVVLAALALSGTLSAADDSACQKDCLTNVIAKGAISGNASKKGYVIATYKGQLTWTFRKAGSVAVIVSVENFSPDCPGVFIVDGVEQTPCGFTLSWNSTDQNEHVITLTKRTVGRFHFHVYSRDRPDDDKPSEIDPELQIDGMAPINLQLILIVLAALLGLATGYRFGWSRALKARTALIG